MSGEYWDFVRRVGLEGRELGFLIAGIIFLIIGVPMVPPLWKLPRHTLTRRDVVATLCAFAISGFCFFMLWGLTHRRFLLRSGAGRYTVGDIAEHYKQKGRPKYLVYYFVTGKRWQTTGDCINEDGKDYPCPPLGSRRYVYFAPADPNTAQITAVPVPDSVRVVPPEGWAKLP